MASQLREAIEKLRRNQGPRLESGRSLMIFGAEDLGARRAEGASECVIPRRTIGNPSRRSRES
jgi:hypothetical protein